MGGGFQFRGRDREALAWPFDWMRCLEYTFLGEEAGVLPHGEDGMFETVIRRFCITDRAVLKVAEMVGVQVDPVQLVRFVATDLGSDEPDVQTRRTLRADCLRFDRGHDGILWLSVRCPAAGVGGRVVTAPSRTARSGIPVWSQLSMVRRDSPR